MRRTLAIAGALSICLAAAPSAAEQGGGVPARRALPTTRVDVSLHQADIQNVLRLFADIGRVNIVAGDEVTGTVTITLRGVRWDHALAAILRSKGLDMEWEDNVVRVVRAEALARERQASVDAAARCRATAPLETRIIRVSHADAETVAALARASLRSDRGSVTVDPRTSSLIVRDVDCP
jgi:type IV pilus assembly protein PilQ